MIQLSPRFFACSLIMSTSLFAAAIVERPVFTGTAFGGAGGIVQYGSKAAVSSGIVAGQPYAEIPSFATSGTGTSTVTLDVQHGFWINLDAISSSTPVLPPLAPQHAFSVKAKFMASAINLELTLTKPSQVTVQLLDLQGRQAMSPWSGNMNSGFHKLEIPVLAITSQPMLLRVQTNAGEKTFRFTPNLLQ